MHRENKKVSARYKPFIDTEETNKKSFYNCLIILKSISSQWIIKIDLANLLCIS